MAVDSAIEQELAELDRQAAAGASGSNGAANGMQDFDLSGYDISDVDPTRKSFSLIPEGTFLPVQITRCNGKTASTGKAMLDLEYTGIAGDYNTRKVWDNIMLEGNKTRYVQLLSAIGLYDNVNKRSLARSASDIFGKKLWLKIAVEKGSKKPGSEEMYPDRNRPAPWDGFYPINTYAIPGEESDAYIETAAAASDPPDLFTASPATPVDEVKVQEEAVSEGVTANAAAPASVVPVTPTTPITSPTPPTPEEIEEESEADESSVEVGYDVGSGDSETSETVEEATQVAKATETSTEVDEADEEMRAMEAELERKRLERKNKAKTPATPAVAVAKESAQAERPANWN